MYIIDSITIKTCNNLSLFTENTLARVPDASHQVKLQSVNWFWRRRFLKTFYHTLVWQPSWSCDLDQLYRLCFTLPNEAPDESWLLIGISVSEKIKVEFKYENGL